MCIGYPMLVMETGEYWAKCERQGKVENVSIALLGEVAVGTHVLVHMGQAVRELDPVEAQQIDDALEGLAAALEGRDFQHLFADLENREPELPPHLKN